MEYYIVCTILLNFLVNEVLRIYLADEGWTGASAIWGGAGRQDLRRRQPDHPRGQRSDGGRGVAARAGLE